MTIHINLPKIKPDDADEKNAVVHLLPCSIKCDGDANVSAYFEPNIVKQPGNSK